MSHYTNRNVLNSNTQGMYTDKSRQYKCPKQNKTTFDCTHFQLVDEYKNKQHDIPLSLFYYSNSNISTILLSIFSSDDILATHTSHG